jgi:hypothetical protein
METGTKEIGRKVVHSSCCEFFIHGQQGQLVEKAHSRVFGESGRNEVNAVGFAFIKRELLLCLFCDNNKKKKEEKK